MPRVKHSVVDHSIDLSADIDRALKQIKREQKACAVERARQKRRKSLVEKENEQGRILAIVEIGKYLQSHTLPPRTRAR